MMLHHDEGYQKDVGDPKAMDAVLTELKQYPDRLARYLLLHEVAKRPGFSGNFPLELEIFCLCFTTVKRSCCVYIGMCVCMTA